MKCSDSSFADGLATVARSVLVQYGICGDVTRVTRRGEGRFWDIVVVTPSDQLTLQLQCSEATPPHVIRSAIARQIESID